MLGVGLILRASGETKFTFRAYLFSALMTIPLTFFLISHYGVWGAMSSAILSFVWPYVIYDNKGNKINGKQIEGFPFGIKCPK